MLWLLRREATVAPHYLLKDLATLDLRVDAHLDGLRVAGRAGRTICEEQLTIREDGEVFIAAVLAFESRSAELIWKVLRAAEQTPDLAGSVASALGWLEYERALPHMQALTQSSHPVDQRIGIAAWAIQRRHPGAALAKVTRCEFPMVRARVLKAAGELHDAALIGELTRALDDADPECRFAAAWSGALFGSPEAVAVLREIAEAGSWRAARAADLAVRRMNAPAAISWQQRLVGDSRHARLAIEVAGGIGDPALLPWLMSLMDQSPLARLAGQSFSFITGLDLADDGLDRDAPESFASGPTDDPQDENVALDPDEHLPWPDPDKVRAWWQRQAGEFAQDTRYLLGRPLAVDWLEEVLRHGRQRQRAAAALELAIRRPGQPLFNVRAPGYRQQQWLGMT